MADFKALISLISSTVDKFNSNVPGIQKQMLNDILLLIKQLDTRGDGIKVVGANLKLLTQVQSRLQKILLNPEYVKSVKDYIGSFNDVTKFQNEYFREIESKFKPPKLAGEIRKQAISSVVNQLTENGMNANVVDKVQDILRKAVTTGGSYSTLSKQLTDFLIDNKSGDGQLVKYTKQITTDALNQFSGQYTQLISSDLGLEWFRYSGSNIETSRPFCLACTDRKFFHISQMPAVLKGDFEEFRKFEGTINKKTELPEGMIPGTDVSNFMTNRGGYNCGHQWRPCSEDLVPADIRNRVYASDEYKLWKGIEVKKEAPIVNLDKKTKPILLDASAGLIPALGELVNRARKIISDTEKKQLISINGLNEIKKFNNSILYSTPTQKILSHEMKTIEKLMETENDILFMPDSYFKSGKKFDVIVFTKNSYYTADLKRITSQNPKTIADTISYGGTQGKNVIVDAVNNIDYKTLANGINSAAMINENLNSVVLFYKGKKKTYMRNKILTKKFVNSVYKDFIKN